MRRILAIAAMSGLASLASSGLITTPAQAEPASHESRTALTLTFAEGEAAWPWNQAASLWCNPPGGSHPQAKEACAQLKTVGGDIAALPTQPKLCTYEYAPVTVTATGFWDGRRVDYQETFQNRCVMLRETGAVYAF